MISPIGHPPPYPVYALILPLFLLISPGTLAQPVCETVKDQVDEFTDSHVLQITASNYSQGPRFDWIAIDDQVCLKIHWTQIDARPAVVFEGDSLMLKLENDTVIVLTSKETTVGKQVRNEEGNKFTEGVYCYWVDHRQLSLINHYWVQKLRIYFREGHQEFEAVNDPGWQMALWKSSNCVRQSLSLSPEPPVISSFGESRNDPDH